MCAVNTKNYPQREEGLNAFLFALLGGCTRRCVRDARGARRGHAGRLTEPDFALDSEGRASAIRQAIEPVGVVGVVGAEAFTCGLAVLASRGRDVWSA